MKCWTNVTLIIMGISVGEEDALSISIFIFISPFYEILENIFVLVKFSSQMRGVFALSPLSSRCLV